MSGKQARAYALSRNKIYCNYCPGYCCYRLEKSTLYLNAVDINRIARYLSITDGEVRKKYIEGRNTFKVKEDNSCIFLSDGKMRARCSIHSARPLQCRQFPYEEPCPYLEREDLLSLLQPYIEKSLVSGE